MSCLIHMVSYFMMARKFMFDVRYNLLFTLKVQSEFIPETFFIFFYFEKAINFERERIFCGKRWLGKLANYGH